MNAKATIGLCGALGLGVGLAAGYGIVQQREKKSKSKNLDSLIEDSTKADPKDQSDAEILIEKISALLESPDDRDYMKSYFNEQVKELIMVSESKNTEAIVSQVPMIQTRLIFALENNVAERVPPEKKAEFNQLKEEFDECISNYAHNSTLDII